MHLPHISYPFWLVASLTRQQILQNLSPGKPLGLAPFINFPQNPRLIAAEKQTDILSGVNIVDFHLRV
jgi:hypothetical protein